MKTWKPRVMAYIVDMLIVTMIVSLIGAFLKNKNVDTLYKESNDIFDMFIKQEIDSDEYLNRYMIVSHDMDKEYIYINIVEAMTLIGCFIIIPFTFNGQTIGKKMFKIKTKAINGNLTYNNLIIRSLLINGLGIILILMALVYVLPDKPYFIVKSLLEVVEFGFLIISLIKMIKSEKHMGLHDILANTIVVESN